MKKILIVIAILVIGLAGFIALQPSDFCIARTATFSAPAEIVFSQINDFHQWEAWSPWAKLDPNAKNSFEGSSSGVGAIFRWAGNKEIGEGNMTILENRSPTFIKIKLEFIKPFVAMNITEFTLVPQGNTTTVTWAMYGKNNFIGKAMNLIMNCDKMVGEMFEKGFTNMKSIVEKNN